MVVDIYKREDPTFIEGLYFDDSTGRMLESSGWYDSSKVLWTYLDDSTHAVKVLNSMERAGVFGEGVCPINDSELIWLTY